MKNRTIYPIRFFSDKAKADRIADIRNNAAQASGRFAAFVVVYGADAGTFAVVEAWEARAHGLTLAD